MPKKVFKSLLYALLITVVYVIASNAVYYFMFRRTMFADIYYYEWVQYVVVAVIMFICTALIEVVRSFIGVKQ